MLRKIIDCVIGMAIAAYVLSHTQIGQQFYNMIAPMPNITQADIQKAMDTAKKAGKTTMEIGGKIYNIVK